MDKKAQRKALEILSTIRGNVNKRSWQCFTEGCDGTAINSHLLQRNGILNTLSEDGHLIQMKMRDLFKIEKDGFVEFKRIGINNVISYPLFCSQHDSATFKSIEEKMVTFESYESQLLFSYRALCAEIRKKQKNINIESSIVNSNILHQLLDRDFFSNMELSTFGNQQAVNDLSFFKKDFEDEIKNPTDKFAFYTLKFLLVKISISAIFSYLRKGIERFSSRPLNTVFINIFPYNGELIVIIGYHKDFSDPWIVDYVNDWKNSQNSQLSRLLSDLLIRVETWTIAESAYKLIPISQWNRYKDLFIETMRNNNLYQRRFKEDYFGSLLK